MLRRPDHGKVLISKSSANSRSSDPDESRGPQIQRQQSSVVFVEQFIRNGFERGGTKREGRLHRRLVGNHSPRVKRRP